MRAAHHGVQLLRAVAHEHGLQHGLARARRRRARARQEADEVEQRLAAARHHDACAATPPWSRCSARGARWPTLVIRGRSGRLHGVPPSPHSEHHADDRQHRPPLGNSSHAATGTLAGWGCAPAPEADAWCPRVRRWAGRERAGAGAARRTDHDRDQRRVHQPRLALVQNDQAEQRGEEGCRRADRLPTCARGVSA